jgi:hypothetical protein
VLPGLRFGASKRLILGSRNQVGFRTAFGGEPVSPGGSLLGPEAVTPEEVFIERLGGSCAEGWVGRIGAGEEGAENKDEGESLWVRLVTLWVGVVGVAGYGTVSNSQPARKGRWLTSMIMG